MAERTCVLCGASITMGRSDRKYCSSLCSSRSFNDRRRGDGRLKAQRKKYAEKRSAWARKAYSDRRYFEGRACLWCSAAFEVRRDSGTRYCSVICTASARRGEWPASKIPWRECPDCGDRRVDHLGGSSMCDSCRSARQRSPRFEIAPTARTAIYERDNWTCQICYEPIDTNVHYLDDWAPSLDHIVPQSKGGGHEPENLRLAHRWCNAVRGDGSYYADEFFVAA